MPLMNVDRARAILTREGLDGIISSSVENNFYLSGVWNSGQQLFPYDGESYVVATNDQPDEGVVVTSIGGADLALTANEGVKGPITFGTFFRDVMDGLELTDNEAKLRATTETHQTGRDSIDALAEGISEMGLEGAAVGVDLRGPRNDVLEQLSSRFPDARFVDATRLFRLIRSVKTPDEIAALRETLRVTEAGFNAAVAAFAEGVTEREIKTVWEQTVVGAGATPGFCLVKFGRDLALGQIPAGDTKLEKGQFAFFDIGCHLNGYKSDIGRLVSFGEPADDLVGLFEASKAGQQVAIDMMKPGVDASVVFVSAVEAVRASGIPSYQRQHVGHAIGIEYYDAPILNASDETVLETGMVFEVETPYYRIGQGGTFIEDTVVLNASGAEIMTQLPREIVVVEA